MPLLPHERKNPHFQVELEKLKLSELTCREAISSIAKIIYSVHDDVKDKEFELELRSVLMSIFLEHMFLS
jgi:20S proteasome subunit alpha 7